MTIVEKLKKNIINKEWTIKHLRVLPYYNIIIDDCDIFERNIEKVFK